MKINSLEFWEQVKKDYSNSQYLYICFASNYFSFHWSSLNNRKEIRKMFGEFLISEKKIRESEFNKACNFLVTSLEAKVFGSYQIRIEFIEWCIKKYSNEK